MSRRRAGPPRGWFIVLCAMFVLVGVAMGQEHGGTWFASADEGPAAPVPAPGVTAPAGEAAVPEPRIVTAPADAPAAPDADGPERITVAAVGDTMMGSPPFRMPPDDGAGLFAGVADLLDGDLVLANVEGTLSTASGWKCPVPGPDATEEERSSAASCYAFQSPPSYAGRLADAGITMANLANNHSYDFGPAGLDETVAALEDAGLPYTGTRDTIGVVETGGLYVAVLGFAPYEWADSLLDVDGAAARVEAAAADHDIVVVTFHGGAEGRDARNVPVGTETYLGEDRGDLRAFARAVVDAGADLVIGHGPHVLRGMEVYEGRLIAYSLGNFVAYGGAFNLSGTLSESMILRATLGRDGTFLGGDIVPVALDADGVPRPGGDAIASVRELSQEDFGDAAPAIAADGTLAPPAT